MCGISSVLNLFPHNRFLADLTTQSYEKIWIWDGGTSSPPSKHFLLLKGFLFCILVGAIDKISFFRAGTIFVGAMVSHR